MDEFTSEEMDQLMAVFKDQAASVLEDMSQDILVLEGDLTDVEAMSRLRRGAHTIKGDSACVGLDRVADLAHRVEDVIEAARGGSQRFDVEVVNLLLNALDEIKSAICGTQVSDISEATLSSLLESITRIERRDNVEFPDETPLEPLAQPIPAVHSNGNGIEKSEIDLITGSISRGRQVFLLEIGDANINSARVALSETQSPALLLKETAMENGGSGHSRIIVETGLSPEAFADWAGRSLAEEPGMGPFLEGLYWVEPSSDGSLAAKRLDQEQESNGHKGQEESPKPANQKRGRDFVRVEASRIDALLNLAGEMVITRSAMNQVLPDLEAAFPRNDLVARFGSASNQMGKLIAELQKSVLKMRMVTIDQVFRRFNRPMRELAIERGKQIEIEVSGADTELDRTLVDLIYEPLLHLLRNAVDHGLETPDEREGCGKSATGKIRMRAYHEGNQVVIEVSDDGRGINREALKERAVSSGVITEAQAAGMTDEDILDLIFASGLSTAREVTRLSGRGVGMSAVKSVVEDLRGSIAVESEIGQGSTFVLRMPLTLAIIRALLFKVQGQIFALPLLVVSEVAKAAKADLVYLDQFETYRLRDHFVSIVRPSQVFGMQAVPAGDGTAPTVRADFFAIIVSAGGRRFGIAADSLIGEQELVIKPLDSEWLQNDALAGASLLGDGQVVLILDAGALFQKALKYEQGRGGSELIAQAR